MGGFLITLFLLCLYFAPYINAVIRKHNSSAAILIINLFLGWTFIGWVILLAWSTSQDNRIKKEQVGE